MFVDVTDRYNAEEQDNSTLVQDQDGEPQTAPGHRYVTYGTGWANFSLDTRHSTKVAF